MAVAAGQGVASATTDGGSTDSASSSQSSSNSGSNSTHSAKSNRANGTAGPKRARSAAKPSAQASNGGSAVAIRSPRPGRALPATSVTPVASAPTSTTAPESTSTTPATDDGGATTPPATTDEVSTPDTSASVKPMAAKAVPVAKAVPTAAATPAPGTGAWYFVGVLTRAVNRLADWPGVPRNFTDITTYTTDFTLDAFDNQFDALIANAIAGSPARWVPDLLGITGMFVTPAIPYSFTDSLNAMGDFLNRIVPKFKIAEGAGTLDVISPYKIMGAAVVGTATVLKDMMNGIYDPAQWVVDVLKETTGAEVTRAQVVNLDRDAIQNAVINGILFNGGGAFSNPERAWNITLPTLTAAQVNPFTIGTYIVLVALYKRFQEMARLTTFTTWTTYDSWHYTNGLGMYAAGTFHAVDPDGGTIVFRADGTLGKTYTTEGGALVTVNTTGGGFTYTPPSILGANKQDAKFFHRSTSEDPEERFDWVTVEAYSADGVKYNIRVGIEIINGTNANPTATVTPGTADSAGVVKGKVNGSDSDGDTLRYTLVGSSVNGLNGNTAYTKNGAANGGIVTLNQTTGEFTYVSNASAPATQSFQVLVNDGHYGNTVVTVTVNNTTSITPANAGHPALNVVTGSVPGSSNRPGVFTGFTLGAAPTKGTVTAFDPVTGAFTYTRNASLGHTTTPDDVVTVIATTADGRTVTLKMAVQPTVANTAPVIVSSTTDVGNADSARWGLNTSTWTQTTKGKITATDADGDTLSYSVVNGTTTNGGTVTFNADGSYTYTITKNQAYFHGAARIGAGGAAVADTFTVAVSDGYGGVAYQNVSIAIYAVNSSPTISVGSLACGFGTCTVTVTTTDPDGDNLGGSLNTSNNGTGSPWYTLSRGSVTVNSGNQHTFSWTGNSNSAGTAQTGVQTYTVYDGYYRVNNGVIDSTYPTRVWVNWNNTTRTTGN